MRCYLCTLTLRSFYMVWIFCSYHLIILSPMKQTWYVRPGGSFWYDIARISRLIFAIASLKIAQDIYIRIKELTLWERDLYRLSLFCQWVWLGQFGNFLLESPPGNTRMSNLPKTHNASLPIGNFGLLWIFRFNWEGKSKQMSYMEMNQILLEFIDSEQNAMLGHKNHWCQIWVSSLVFLEG